MSPSSEQQGGRAAQVRRRRPRRGNPKPMPKRAIALTERRCTLRRGGENVEKVLTGEGIVMGRSTEGGWALGGVEAPTSNFGSPERGIAQARPGSCLTQHGEALWAQAIVLSSTHTQAPWWRILPRSLSRFDPTMGHGDSGEQGWRERGRGGPQFVVFRSWLGPSAEATTLARFVMPARTHRVVGKMNRDFAAPGARAHAPMTTERERASALRKRLPVGPT